MKIFKILFFIFIFSNCSNLNNNKDIKWNKAKNIMINSNKLKVGDILIKKKILTFSSMFGHSAVVVSKNKIGEYPKINFDYCETGILDWLYDDRKIIILRYKFFDKKFEKEFLKNIEKYKGKKYKLSFNKYNTEHFYCSKYVWLIYLETAKTLNYKLDFDKYKKNLYIFPYDFFYSNDFEIINLYN